MAAPDRGSIFRMAAQMRKLGFQVGMQDYRERSKEQAMAEMQRCDLPALESALAELGRRSYEAGRTVEIAVYGGSALLLTLNRQVNTRDIDAVFEKDKDFIKKLASEIAAESGWDENWLSAIDADPAVKTLFRTYPSEEQPGLRVFVAKPEYLFAMKCRAMRVGGVDSSSDIEDIKDIKLLAHAIGITNSADAMTLVEKYYPRNLLEPKTRFGLEEIFSSLDVPPSDELPSLKKP